MQTKVNDFFESHPAATEVYGALGVLFTDKEKAARYLGGVTGKEVETFSRPSQQPLQKGGTSLNEADADNTDEKPADSEPPAGSVEETQAPESEPATGKEAEPLTPEELEAGHNALLQGKVKPVAATKAPAPATKPQTKSNKRPADKPISAKK